MCLKEYDKELLKLNKQAPVYIYGAGDVAREVFFCLSKPPYCINVVSFLVTEVNNTTIHDIEGVPVISYDDESIDKTKLVIVAVLEKYRDEICELLDTNNMSNRIIMTFESDLWSTTRSKSFETYCNEKGYPFIFYDTDYNKEKVSHINDTLDCCVYVTRSLKDKGVSCTLELQEWEREVYAGAAFDSNDITGVRDDEGVNISWKNRKYCELTVMYWAWKNTSSEYVGVSHYRRRFDFTKEELLSLTDGSIDAIMTIPMINVPSVGYMYGKNHDAEDWIVLKNVVDRLFPDYSQTMNEIEESNYYIPYNMFIMKRSVFVAYSEWLFSILEECEKIIGDKKDIYQNRYIGFLAERLMTVYFIHHSDEFTVLFCNKRFLE